MTGTNGAAIGLVVTGNLVPVLPERDPELVVDENALHIDIVHDATGWYAFDNVVPMWGEGKSAGEAVDDLIKSLGEYRALNGHRTSPPHIAAQMRYIGKVV